MPAFAELSFPSCPLNILHRLRYFLIYKYLALLILPLLLAICLYPVSCTGAAARKGKEEGCNLPSACVIKKLAIHEMSDMMRKS
jgi:hypothetical protein